MFAEVVVAVSGELDCSSAEEVACRVLRAAAGAEVVWIDLSELAFIDCAGARALQSAQRRAESSGAVVTLRFTRPGPVARLLDLLGVTERTGLHGPTTRLVAKSGNTDALRTEVEHLRRALATRDLIWEAKLIVARSTGCTAGEAFDLLKRQSQHENRKLREIASDLVGLDMRRRSEQLTSGSGALRRIDFLDVE